MTVSLSIISQEEKHILKNLYSLYLHDLTEFTDSLTLSSDGSFEYDSFDMIWEMEGITPLFLKSEKEIVGFILLLERPFLKKELDYCINDFFIIRKYRGTGVSRALVEKLLRQKKGEYYLVVLEKNYSAISFWRRTLRELNIPFKEEPTNTDKEDCLIFTF